MKIIYRLIAWCGVSILKFAMALCMIPAERRDEIGALIAEYDLKIRKSG